MMKKLGDLYVNVSSKGVEATNAKLGMTEKKATMASKAAGMLKTALLGIGAAVVIRGLKSVINEFINYTVQIDKFTKQTGMATDTIQKLVYAAEQEHASLEALNKGLMNLTVRLGYAGDEQEVYLRYFRALNIEYKKADGTLRNTYDVFLDIADAVSKGTLSTKELAAVLQLFGARSGKELIPLLKKGRYWFEEMGDEAERLGKVLGGEVIIAGKAFDDQMTKMDTAMKGIKYEIAGGLIPVLQNLSEIVTALSPAIKTLAGAMAVLSWQAKTRSSLENYIKSLFGWKSEIEKLTEDERILREGLGKMPEVLVTATGAVDEYKKSVADLNAEYKIAIEGYRLFLELDAARAAVAWELAKGYGELTRHQQVELEIMELMQDKKRVSIEQYESAIEMINFTTEALSVLGSAYMDLDRVLLDNSYSFADWGQRLITTLMAVMIKLLALAAIIKFLEALGVPAGAIISAGSKMGLFQTPTGDAFAYREGRDFGKMFFGGFSEQMNGMLQGINTNQEPVNIVIHTGDPSTFVEFVSGMPNVHKSKFYREVTEKARLLES